MRIPIDYRDMFDFEICYPVVIEKRHLIVDVLTSLFHQGTIPTVIIKDKEHPLFKRLIEDLGQEAYDKAQALIFIVKVTKEYLA